ncbi:ParB/RepB/Spo0J family partition protein [Maridesulfovibrio zosterae]|uniref:ParB/RepB/Spo0J family partition protein n=1 Tax=Maridesulfovibrio zosterae TaxID=82171 RepID=UPI00041E4439|nr:ParB/RepB/Spo0J family partition protein [Maridesulfovibrio zosterae]
MNDIHIYSLETAEIDCCGNWLLYPESAPEKLILSFKKNGQLVPVLIAKEDGRNLLIAGRTRVAAAAKLGMKVSAIFVDAADDISRAVMHLEENSSRTVDDSLRLAVFRFFFARMDKTDLSKEIGPLLGLKLKSREMNFWLDWMDMEPEFDLLLAAGNIPLAAVSVLSRLSASDRISLLPYFEKVSWSRSNAVNFLTWLYETARREEKSVSELLKEGALDTARENESPKDAVARLCRSAKQFRFPHLSRLKRAHEKIVTEICAGTKWRVDCVGNFETGEVMLQTRFKSREVMQKAMDDLESIEKLQGWDELFELGRDK